MVAADNPQPFHAAIERYFEIALYMLVLTGFATLASTGGLDIPTMVLAGGAILFRGYCVATRSTLLIPERWTTILTLGYVAFYLADYLVMSRAFVSSAVHLVLFVLVVRVFSARRDRDHYFLAVISFSDGAGRGGADGGLDIPAGFRRVHAYRGGDVHPDGDAAYLGGRGVPVGTGRRASRRWEFRWLG